MSHLDANHIIIFGVFRIKGVFRLNNAPLCLFYKIGAHDVIPFHSFIVSYKNHEMKNNFTREALSLFLDVNVIDNIWAGDLYVVFTTWASGRVVSDLQPRAEGEWL
jgi:hypothetical protein